MPAVRAAGRRGRRACDDRDRGAQVAAIAGSAQHNIAGDDL